MLATFHDLQGRRVLVTGASSGIGRGIALALLDQGAAVAVHGFTQPEAARALAAGHPRAAVVLGDLGDSGEVTRVCDEAEAALGGLDAVIHSAGIWAASPAADYAPDPVERIFRANTFSAFWLGREVARRIQRGSYTIIGSTAGQRGEPGHAAYAASKAALRGLVHSLAQELGPRVRVNLICPGWVRTPMVDAIMDATLEARITRWVPDGRLGTVEDCNHAALFLTSEASGHLTGAELDLSGGALLPIPAR